MFINDEKKKVTIYSVAHEAGVSLATVSRVINDSSLVKEDTKKKVEDAILKLGYRPNAVAQGLALKKTTTIALIVPDSSFLYIGKIINGLLDVAKIYKYNILLHTSSSSINEMDEIIDNVIKSRADGVIVYNDTLSEKEMANLQSYEIPVVYLGHESDDENTCGVYVDYTKGLYEVTSDYLNRGIEDIVLIQDRKNPRMCEYALKGIEKAFTEKGKEFKGYVSIPEQYHNSFDYLVKYFSEHKHKLIFAIRDSQAMSVVNACNENNISIPLQSELVCVMDSRYNDMVRPQISTFVVPSYDVGALAMRVMTKMLEHSPLKENNYKLNFIYKKKATTR